MESYSLSFFEVSSSNRGIDSRHVFGLVNVSLEMIDNFTSKFSNKKEMFDYLNHLYLNVPDPVLRGEIIRRYASGETLSLLDQNEEFVAPHLNMYNKSFDDEGFFKITYQSGEQRKRMDIMYAPSLVFDEMGIRETFRRSVENHNADFLAHVMEQYSSSSNPLQQINVQLICNYVKSLKAGYEVDEEALLQIINYFITNELYMIRDYDDLFYTQFYLGNKLFFETVINRAESMPNLGIRNKASKARQIFKAFMQGQKIDENEFIDLIKSIADEEIYVRFSRPKTKVENYKGKRKLAVIISKYQAKNKCEKQAYGLV